MKQVPDLLVVGTDTGVGKTVVSLLLMQLLYAKGFAPFYLKPFQTGCSDVNDAGSDAAFVYRHTEALQLKESHRSIIHCYPNPKAPYFAARDAGAVIDIEQVGRIMDDLRLAHRPLVVEAAGGLLVPITEDMMVVDLMSMIDCRPVLVARTALGTINHTLLSIETLRQRKMEPLGIVLVASDPSPILPDMVAQNIEAIERFSGIEVAGVIPFLSDFCGTCEPAFKVLEKIIF